MPGFDEKMARVRRLAPDVAAIAALVLTLVLFYWGYLLGRSFIWDDTLMEFYPGVNYFAVSLHAGHFPLRIPGVHDGQPFYSDPQIAVFYPLQWILIPFVQHDRLPFVVYQRYIVFHYILGGLFMYTLLKRLKLSPVAALTGALVFSLSGFASLRIVNIVMMQVYIWLPLQLLCVHRFVQTKNRGAWLGIVVATLMSLLGGHQQTTAYCSYLVAGYWFYCAWCAQRDAESDPDASPWPILAKEVPKVFGTFILVLGLAAVMLLPALENWSHTGRPRVTFENMSDLSLPYHQLLTLWVPNFFGKTIDGNPPVSFWGYDPVHVTVAAKNAGSAKLAFWQYWEFGAYPGQIFWLAVPLLLFNWRAVDDKRTARFFLIAWIFATWFMMGRYGGLFQVLYHVLPGASLFRGPAKMSCVATFAAAVLSACAVDLLFRRMQPFRYWPVFIPPFAYGCLALLLSFSGQRVAVGFSDITRLSWSQRETYIALAVATFCAVLVVGAVHARDRLLRNFFLYGVVILTITDFHYAYGAFQHGHISPDDYYPETGHLLSVIKDFREKLGPFRFGQIRDNQLTEELATHRNKAYFHNFLEVPEGYTSFYSDNVAQFREINNEDAKVGIQNIQALVTSKAGPHGEDWLTVGTDSLPRTKFYRQIRQYDNRKELLSAFDRDEIDWRNEVAVSSQPGFEAPPANPQRDVTSTEDAVHFVGHTPENYSVEYDVNSPGIMFVSEAFYPGWVLDNPRAKLIEVFGAFQGIWIPEAGHGQINVHFSPPVLRWSVLATILSLAGVLLVMKFGHWNCRVHSTKG